MKTFLIFAALFTTLSAAISKAEWFQLRPLHIPTREVIEHHSNEAPFNTPYTYSYGAIIRGDTTERKIAIVFTGDEYAEGGSDIAAALKKYQAKASFFLTGRFYRNQAFKSIIDHLKKDGHYLGAHSDEHLLYADWSKRDSLLVTQGLFRTDLNNNYRAMQQFGIAKSSARFYLPPYEWYNDTIAAWTKRMDLQLINFTPGTLSHADYTTPDAKNYRSSEVIWNSIVAAEKNNTSGLNGYILLLHIGVGEKRTDKFHTRLPQLLHYLKTNGYELVRVDELLKKVRF